MSSFSTIIAINLFFLRLVCAASSNMSCLPTIITRILTLSTISGNMSISTAIMASNALLLRAISTYMARFSTTIAFTVTLVALLVLRAIFNKVIPRSAFSAVKLLRAISLLMPWLMAVVASLNFLLTVSGHMTFASAPITPHFYW
mmetsp:Transcript_28830/g.5215  ORF Transcript_28830/g.5215 Transcript_28830/m.5215 type:complete len:145 (+) Transcript_28830:62-496(+)